jgi:glycosyltransferase involved in cell wall biosynthesis
VNDSNNMKLAFVHETASSWMLQDLALLRRFAEVDDVSYHGVLHSSRVLKAVRKASCVVVWGAAGQAFSIAVFFGILFRRRVIVFVNGSEVSSRQTWAYSTLRASARFAASRLLLSHVDVMVFPSKFSKLELESHTRPKRSEVLSHGVDTKYFTFSRGERNLIVTVCSSDSIRKGVDRFLELAKLLPSRQFALVGRACNEPSTRSRCPPNVELVGEVSRDKILSVYHKAMYYCQLSRHEAFGIAMAESMSCGCVPVVSDAGALPSVVGDCGFVVRNGEPSKAAEIIEANWSRGHDMGRLAAERIRTSFSLETRINRLRRIIESSPNCPAP